MQNSFNYNRLTQARILRGYQQNELAQAVGLSNDSISKYEKGIQQPKFDNIQAIANLLNFKVEFFYKPYIELNNQRYFFRKQKTTKKQYIDQTRIIADILTEFKMEIIDKYINLSPLKLPKNLKYEISKEIDNIKFEEIEHIANELREFWQLGCGPISDTIKLLENVGILTFKMKTDRINEKIDGLSWWNGDRPLCLLTETKSAVRGRYDAIHELGHTVLHKNIAVDDLSPNEYEILEKEANHFASCLLLPKKSLSDEFISLNIDSLIPLKQRWKVSMQCIVMRAFEIDLITENQKIYFFKQINAKGYKKNEPLDDKINHERHALLARIYSDLNIKDSFGVEKAINMIDFKEMLGLNTETLPYALLNSSEKSPNKNITFH